MLLCDKQPHVDKMMPATTTKTTTATRRTAMVPSRRSISLSTLSSSASELPVEAKASSSTVVVNTPTDDLVASGNLYCMPESIPSTYRPLPISGKILLAVVSAALTTKSMWKHLEWLLICGRAPYTTVWIVQWWTRHFAMLTLGIFPWRTLIKAIIKTVSLYVVTYFALQDILPRFRPARISTAELVSTYTLPSPLSRYGQIRPGEGHYVHWLEHQNETVADKKFDAVYVNHGFGASSLSWLPVIPSLATDVGGKIVMGHDAPGFGFTDRPDTDLQYYSIANSATIGSELLKLRLGDTSAGNKKCALLIGHSMGSLATLQMARQLDPSVTLHIVLVAPAVGLRPQPKVSSVRSKTLPKKQYGHRLTRPVGTIAANVACFGLRRLVGRRNFWRDGLRLAWGDPSCLRHSDVLRYQWPSIGEGWERGLLRFTRSQLSSLSFDDTSDTELVRKVLDQPNVQSIDVFLGSRDRVVPAKHVCKFLLEFPEINVKVMEGLGHNPFEEDCDTFIAALQTVLK